VMLEGNPSTVDTIVALNLVSPAVEIQPITTPAAGTTLGAI
jgi:hypothetical protein